jgi:prepilin-type N-terminal cleavage/methylation domain-containing protein
MTKPLPQSDRSGFTLLEILIAVFILAIVISTVLGTFTGVITSSRQAEKKVEIFQTGRAILDLICADVRGMLPVMDYEKGAAFYGELESVDGEVMSKMDFLTTHFMSAGNFVNPFDSEVGYRMVKNPDGESYALWRRSQSPQEYPYNQGGREVPLCRSMENFRLEFVHNGDRKESLINVFPDAVVIDFTLNLEGESERFFTMVRPMVVWGGR